MDADGAGGGDRIVAGTCNKERGCCESALFLRMGLNVPVGLRYNLRLMLSGARAQLAVHSPGIVAICWRHGFHGACTRRSLRFAGGDG